MQPRMHKTRFRIPKMDCPSEEQMIRMQLSGLSRIHALDFDIPHRLLTVYHTGPGEPILEQLEALKLDAALLDSLPVEETPAAPEDAGQERKLLGQVLAINLFFFMLELTTGLVARSMGLVADSLDMLADSIVYGLALSAVGGSVARKKSIARWAGYFQLALAVLGLAEVIRRFAGWETLPEFQTMILISALALTGNALCLYLLQKSKSREAHLQASMIFTSNDVIANLGVMASGGLVYLTQSKYPDLVVGSIVFFIVARGAFKILSLSRDSAS